MLLRLLLSSLALFELASAHAVFNGLFINGHNSPQCVRQPINNSPMTKVSSPDMRCNVGGSKGVAGICDIKPGDNVTMEMHQQPSDHTCKDQAIGGNHFGPVMIYMCSVPDAKTASGDCSWVKIAEDSYAGTTASWGTEILNKNCGKKSVKVPKNLKPGNYLLRAEALALHTAQGREGAQFYMTCFQVRVKGEGTTSLPAGVKIPGAYKATDPGILINIYKQPIKYKSPGPSVWKQTS